MIENPEYSTRPREKWTPEEYEHFGHWVNEGEARKGLEPVVWNFVTSRADFEEVWGKLCLNLDNISRNYNPSEIGGNLFAWVRQSFATYAGGYARQEATHHRRHLTLIDGGHAGTEDEDRSVVQLESQPPDHPLHITMEALIGRLKPEYQQVIRGQYYENKTQVELARDLGISVDLVKSRNRRARQTLKNWLRR